MTPLLMSLSQSLIALAVLWHSLRTRGLATRQSAALIAAALILFVASGFNSEGPQKTLLTLPYAILGLGAIGITTLVPHLAVPQIHEGGASLFGLTFLYFASNFLTEIPIYTLMVPAATSVLLIAIENFRSGVPSVALRFSVSLIYSYGSALLCFYQLLGAGDILQFSEARRESISWVYWLESLGIQLTIFAGVLHMSRVLSIFPAKNERQYFQRLTQETIPGIAAHIEERNVPQGLLCLAWVLHAAPLIANRIFEFAPVRLMLSYAILVSPWAISLLFQWATWGKREASEPDNSSKKKNRAA